MTNPTNKAPTYAHAPGGLPDQQTPLTGRAIFTEAYALLPAATMRDIVTSPLPHWRQSRAWVLARPLSGFAESFSQYLMEVEPDGGSTNPEPDPTAQAVLFITHGTPTLTFGGTQHQLRPGSYAYLPPNTSWQFHNPTSDLARFHLIRKRYRPVDGIAPPAPFITHEQDITPAPMPDTDGGWSTTRFVDPADMAHDMHVNIVTFTPGARIPFEETHVMEHGLYVLSGRASYLLNRDWHEVGPGDFMWLRAFCPQACIAKGAEPFRYLLYKDVNRHMPLGLGE